MVIDAAALAYGTLIHAWFEQVKWLEDGLPSDDRLREVAAAISELALSLADIDRLLADFRAMLARPAISACLQRSAYHRFDGGTLTVETERPIAVRDGNRLLVGNIDRLVTICRDNHPIAAEIIDFKTDAVAADDQTAVAKKSGLLSTPALRLPQRRLRNSRTRIESSLREAPVCSCGHRRSRVRLASIVGIGTDCCVR